MAAPLFWSGFNGWANASDYTAQGWSGVANGLVAKTKNDGSTGVVMQVSFGNASITDTAITGVENTRLRIGMWVRNYDTADSGSLIYFYDAAGGTINASLGLNVDGTISVKRSHWGRTRGGR